VDVVTYSVNKIRVEQPIYRVHRAVIFAIAQNSCLAYWLIEIELVTF